MSPRNRQQATRRQIEASGNKQPAPRGTACDSQPRAPQGSTPFHALRSVPHVPLAASRESCATSAIDGATRPSTNQREEVSQRQSRKVRPPGRCLRSGSPVNSRRPGKALSARSLRSGRGRSAATAWSLPRRIASPASFFRAALALGIPSISTAPRSGTRKSRRAGRGRGSSPGRPRSGRDPPRSAGSNHSRRGCRCR